MLLSRATGQVVRSSDGQRLGRVVDLSARVDADPVVVTRVVVGTRRHTAYLVSWQQVQAFTQQEMRLVGTDLGDADAVDPRHLRLRLDELLLRRDVLDAQIVDVESHRLARVGDVVLAGLDDGRLRLVAVDVGADAVLCRLGLHWLSRRLGEQAVSWADLHLTSARGHLVQLATPVSAVHRLDAADLAELLTRLNPSHAGDVIRSVGPQRAALALVRAHPHVAERLVHALPRAEAVGLQPHLPVTSAPELQRLLVSEPTRARRRLRRLAGWRMHRPPQAQPARPRTR